MSKVRITDPNTSPAITVTTTGSPVLETSRITYLDPTRSPSYDGKGIFHLIHKDILSSREFYAYLDRNDIDICVRDFPHSTMLVYFKSESDHDKIRTYLYLFGEGSCTDA